MRSIDDLSDDEIFEYVIEPINVLRNRLKERSNGYSGKIGLRCEKILRLDAQAKDLRKTTKKRQEAYFRAKEEAFNLYLDYLLNALSDDDNQL